MTNQEAFDKIVARLMDGMKKLDELEVGDEVGYLAYSLCGRRVINRRIGKVDKVTKTQIVAFGERWNKSNGRIRGDKCHGAFLLADADKVREEIAQARREKSAESNNTQG